MTSSPVRLRRPPAPDSEVVMVEMSSGPRLALEIREPRRASLGTAILLHPMMASRRVWNLPREGGVVSTLNDAGLRTLALDFRGHGESGPPASRGGTLTYDELVNEEIPAICRAARERWPAERVTLVGHSLGGHAAMASVAAGACEPDGLVLLATSVWMPSEEQNPVLSAKKAAIARACRGLSRTIGYFPARALGLGSDDEAAPLIESLVGFWRRDRWVSADGSIDYLEEMGNTTIAVLAIASAGDSLMCTPACAARFAKRLPPARAGFELVRQADDGGDPPNHLELLTTKKAVSSWRRIASFCAGR
jgi:pimeloyl-ACP methyl ester carboxylesterase